MMNDMMARQFEKPEGLLGKLAGKIMDKENREINKWTIEYLQPIEGDRILEIGYGPGFAIKEIASSVSNITVHGVDISEKMKETAESKNHDEIVHGKVQLYHVDIHDFDQGILYHKIFSVNNYPLWKKPHESLLHIMKLLENHGELIITVQPREEGANDETAKSLGESMKEDLLLAGYCDIQISYLKIRPVLTVCVRARK
ncbi:SAM-dependent methyltransferase [Bacillus massilinigeriensis]|uniref:SAM-dependent methyltransferase n=1 Tax=Bacillus mediterraneensis TaxID=1805474 RepID=UPI000A622A68|nr:class I SAM-dependent methyltransferase [Bacillus mediterraneensis]